MKLANRHMIGASLIALLTAAPAVAQTSDSTNTSETPQANQQAQSTASDGSTTSGSTSSETTTQQAQGGSSGDAEMPEAASTGDGMSGIAQVDRPSGEIGATPNAQDTRTGQMHSGQMHSGQMQTGDGTGSNMPYGSQQNAQGERTVTLNTEEFGNVYERGFRQGYIHGVTEARQQFLAELGRMDRQMGYDRQSSQQYDRGSDRQASGNQGWNQSNQSDQSELGFQPYERQRVTGSQDSQNRNERWDQRDQSAGMQSDRDQWNRSNQEQQRAAQGSVGDSGGTIIVLPPGVSPEAFVQQLMQQGGMSQSGG